MRRGATISECGTYRYALWRTWERGPTMTFVMLNPSTADAEQDDPTIRRCLSFAQREGCGEIVVVNLFAYRTPHPKALEAAVAGGTDPFGPEQTRIISQALAQRNGPVVAAWGAHRIANLALDKLPTHLPLQCLGTTADGSPRHPLYVRGDTPLTPWTRPVAPDTKAAR